MFFFFTDDDFHDDDIAEVLGTVGSVLSGLGLGIGAVMLRRRLRGRLMVLRRVGGTRSSVVIYMLKVVYLECSI